MISSFLELLLVWNSS